MPRLSNTVLNTMGQAGQGAGLFTVGQQLGGLGAKKRARDQRRSDAAEMKATTDPVKRLELLAQQAMDRGDAQVAATLTNKAAELKQSGILTASQVSKNEAQAAGEIAATERERLESSAEGASNASQQAIISSAVASLAQDDSLKDSDKVLVSAINKQLKQPDVSLTQEGLKSITGALEGVLERNKATKAGKTYKMQGGEIFVVDDATGKISRTGETFATPEVNEQLVEMGEQINAAENNYGKYSSLAQAVAERGVTEGGLVGQVITSVTEGLGIAGAEATLQRDLEELRVSGMIANLPPGVASDKDMALVERGASNFNGLSNEEASRVLTLMAKAEEHKVEVLKNKRKLTSATNKIFSKHHQDYEDMLAARAKSMNSLKSENYSTFGNTVDREYVRLKARELIERKDEAGLAVLRQEHPDIDTMVSSEKEAYDLRKSLNESELFRENNWSF